jgi:hypothetical protein
LYTGYQGSFPRLKEDAIAKMDVGSRNITYQDALQTPEMALENLKLQQADVSRWSIHSDFIQAANDQNDRHYSDLKEVMGEIKEALPGINAKRPTYDRVLVFSIYWRKSDLVHIREKSKELQDVFRVSFNFEIAEPFEIPSEKYVYSRDRSFHGGRSMHGTNVLITFIPERH